LSPENYLDSLALFAVNPTMGKWKFIFAGTLCAFFCFGCNSQKEKEQKAIKEKKQKAVIVASARAALLHAHLMKYALEDPQGGFPPDIKSFLTAKQDGHPPSESQHWESAVFDYRGANLDTTSSPNSLLLRYRIEGVPEKEVRLYVAGNAVVSWKDAPVGEVSAPAN
jgi:hypothetical protein